MPKRSPAFFVLIFVLAGQSFAAGPRDVRFVANNGSLSPPFGAVDLGGEVRGYCFFDFFHIVERQGEFWFAGAGADRLPDGRGRLQVDGRNLHPQDWADTKDDERQAFVAWNVEMNRLCPSSPPVKSGSSAPAPGR